MRLLLLSFFLSILSPLMVSSSTQSTSIQLLTNPVTDIAKLKIVHSINQQFIAEWRNGQGLLVETQNFNISPGINNIQLVTPTGIAPGINYLRIYSDDKKERQLFRIIRQ